MEKKLLKGTVKGISIANELYLRGPIKDGLPLEKVFILEGIICPQKDEEGWFESVRFLRNLVLEKKIEFQINKKNSRWPLLEASGGITINNIRAIARTGVDRISVGGLTHHQRWINFSMEFAN